MARPPRQEQAYFGLTLGCHTDGAEEPFNCAIRVISPAGSACLESQVGAGRRTILSFPGLDTRLEVGVSPAR